MLRLVSLRLSAPSQQLRLSLLVDRVLSDLGLSWASPRSTSTSIIFEIDNDDVLAGVQCIFRSNASLINAYEIVVEDRFALQQV